MAAFDNSHKSNLSPAQASRPASTSANIQTKLNVGKPNDAYEQEADRVADKLVRKPAATTSPAVQKMEEEEIQTMPISQIQRVNEEEEVQTKPGQLVQREAKEELQMKENGMQTASDNVSSQIAGTKGGGSPLSSPIRAQMESGIGADFSGVRIHTGSRAENLSQQLNAQAFTVGNDVYFNKGKYNPESQGGKHLLAHELTHTVQQGKSPRKMIQRELVFGANSAVVGYKFVVGSDLPIPFLQLAQKVTKDGTVSSNDLLKLRAWAINNRGTVDDRMRMFMAGILDQTNLTNFNSTKLKAGEKFSFPFSTITSARQNRINNLERNVNTVAIDQLTYEAAKALLYEGPAAMGQKLNERDAAIEQKLLELATSRYHQVMTNTIAYAKANNVSLPNLLQATINSASDSTRGDRAMAAIIFTVARAAGLSNSSELMSGKIQVDAIVPSAFKSLLGNKTVAGYVTQGGAAGYTKGDTLYVQNNMDINSLSHRSTVIHEMTHAKDDANADPTKAPVDTPVLDLEYRAYKAQCNYILEQVANAPAADWTKILTQLNPDITRIMAVGIVYETYTNKAKYKPVLIELLKVQSGNAGGEAAQATRALTKPRAHYKAKFLAAINAGYGLTQPGAQTTVPLDGLAGSSLIDWINR